MTRPEMVLDTIEKVKTIRERLQVTKSRQKSFADRRWKPLEFTVGDRVILKVSPLERCHLFRKERQVKSSIHGPFVITHRIGKVAYKLELREALGGIHPAFHVSHLRKYLSDENLQMPLDQIQVDQ